MIICVSFGVWLGSASKGDELWWLRFEIENRNEREGTSKYINSTSYHVLDPSGDCDEHAE
jgi:hypothetical protein